MGWAEPLLAWLWVSYGGNEHTLFNSVFFSFLHRFDSKLLEEEIFPSLCSQSDCHFEFWKHVYCILIK